MGRGERRREGWQIGRGNEIYSEMQRDQARQERCAETEKARVDQGSQHGTRDEYY